MNQPNYKAEVDHISESEWSQWMDCFEDANLYQTWSYGAVRWGSKNLSHIVVKRDAEVAAMAQLRIVRPGGFKAGIAYLRWGPMCHRKGEEIDAGIVRAMAEALREEYVEKRGLYLEILPNAFAGSVRAGLFQSAFGGFASKPGISLEKYRTFVLDLSPSLEELRSRLEKKWRNQLNAAERNNLQVIEGETGEQFRTFCGLYTEMWERKRFETGVRVEEFGRMQEQLPASQRLRILICAHRQQAVAGLVYSAIGQSAIYLLGATNRTGMEAKAAYPLQWTVVQRLKEYGVRYYDLGGIDPDANPGVYHFKRGLSGTDMSHADPLVACSNSFSAVLAKAGKVVRGGWRGPLQRLAHA